MPTIEAAVERYEAEIAGLTRDLASARTEIHDLNSEVHALNLEMVGLRADLSRVLSILDARQKADSRFWDHAASICTAFANDGKVRLALVAGVIAIGLVLSGVTALSWRNGGLTFEADRNEAARAMDVPAH